MFFDPSLSASGRISCATCHSPEDAYGPPNGRAVQPGGAKLNRSGTRSVPSLCYTLNSTPIWHQELEADPLERLMDMDNSPRGGFGWDGRFDTLHDQASFPLLNADEMGNLDAGHFVTRLRKSGYAEDFLRLYGKDAFSHPEAALRQAGYALERFELQDASFQPYTSKFDLYLDGKATLTRQELRGMKLFDDPKGGNCASCHQDQRGADGSHPIFTNYQFEALGVPRNLEIPANQNPHFFDLGLCGPFRKDLTGEKAFCGMFKTPTLRNVATRKVFFHNGRFHTLRLALEFYVQRDTNPGKWYPVEKNAFVDKFDDMPVALRRNVDTVDLPLTRKKGERPIWNDAEIDDVIAFLKTLNDGYKPTQKIIDVKSATRYSNR